MKANLRIVYDILYFKAQMMKSKEDKADAERKKAAEGGFFGGKILFTLAWDEADISPVLLCWGLMLA